MTGNDAELETLVIRVRADTSGFMAGVGDIRRELDGPLAQGVDRAGGSIERALARAAVTGKFGFEDLRRVALTALADIAASAVRTDLGALFGGNGNAGVLGSLASSVAGLFGGAPGTSAGWDRFSSVDVMLLSDRMWLESRSERSVLAGANLALIGDEIIQFASAESIAPRIFRLSGLLRGRRGSESRIAGHAAGERFVLLDQAAMLACPFPGEALGTEVKLRSAGVEDGAAASIAAVVSGLALQPLSPAHLRLETIGGDVVATWIRRSRDGFGWADFVEAPLGESAEVYRVDILRDDRLVRQVEVFEARFVYSAAMQAVDGGGDIAMTVRQLSAAVGPGWPARVGFPIAVQGEQT
jgi:hypothetical protein